MQRKSILQGGEGGSSCQNHGNLHLYIRHRLLVKKKKDEPPTDEEDDDCSDGDSVNTAWGNSNSQMPSKKDLEKILTDYLSKLK